MKQKKWKVYNDIAIITCIVIFGSYCFVVLTCIQYIPLQLLIVVGKINGQSVAYELEFCYLPKRFCSFLK